MPHKREDHPPRVGNRRRQKRRGSEPCCAGNANHRREKSSSHRKSPDRPIAGTECGRRSRTRRRARQRICRGGIGSTQTGRTQSDRGDRNWHRLIANGQSGTGSERDAEPIGAGHYQNGRVGNRNQRRVPRAGCWHRPDQSGDPATRQSDPAERQCVRADCRRPRRNWRCRRNSCSPALPISRSKQTRPGNTSGQWPPGARLFRRPHIGSRNPLRSSRRRAMLRSGANRMVSHST